jgi:hypothetical protein
MKGAKGMQIGAPFSLRSTASLDDREEFDTLQDMLDFPETSLPPLITSTIKATGEIYTYCVYNTPNVDRPELNKWREGGLGGSSSNTYTKAELDAILGKDPSSGQIGTNITELENTIGEDAVIDDSDPDNPVIVTPATGIKKDIDDLKEQVKNASGASDAEKVTYDNTYGYTSVEDALNDILDKINYVKPTITSLSITPSATEYEIGKSVPSVQFDWALNKDVTSQSLTDCTVTITDRTATYSTPLTSTKTFTLTVSDGKNSASSSKTISFLPKIYWGGAEQPASYDDAFVLGLSNSKLASKLTGTYTVDASGTKYGYLVVPASLGKPAVQISGFDTDLDLVATFDHTNASGHKQSYNVYQAYQGLGVFDMEVK